MYAAGIQLTGPAGAGWRIAPQPGNLSTVDAGLSTSRGQFAVQVQRQKSAYETFAFQTPSSTRGDVVLPGTWGPWCRGQVSVFHWWVVWLVDYLGGNWKPERAGH